MRGQKSNQITPRGPAFFAASAALLLACGLLGGLQQDDQTPPTFVFPTDASGEGQPGAEETPVSPTEVSQPPPVPTEPPTPAPASIPDPGNYRWETVVSGFRRPTEVIHAGDGSGRLFIVEQAGVIYVLQEGQQPSVFMDIRERVGDSANEQGLLGLAFHPNYEQNGYFYVNYTNNSGDTEIARFQVSSNPDQGDPASETRILSAGQPFGNHNGGGLAFGPDGYLYIALGDGGAANDPAGRAQSLNTHLGKLLRIDVDGGSPYSIPPGNPFANGGGLAEIWAYGLRNPWRFSFDALTGNLFIADVGQNQWEEVNALSLDVAGANYGWDYREGAHQFEGSPPANLSLIEPMAEYNHSLGCSVTGGYVYRGAALPAWQGVYLYGDYCTGYIWALVQRPDGSWQNSLVFELNDNISSFGLDGNGELYIAGHQGTIYRLAAR
jgi:glucose/arabinose dehydrogenase